MVCPHCGEEIPDGVAYCNECGGDVNAAPSTPSPRLAGATATAGTMSTERNRARRMSETDEKIQNTGLGISIVFILALGIVVICLIALFLLLRH